MTREEMIKNLIEEKMSECGLFVGKFDSENSHMVDFMYGVKLVMDYLAYEVSEEYGDEFTCMFLQNMVNSLNKV